MKYKEIECYPSEIPLNSIATEDIKNLQGAMLIKKNTIIDETVIGRLKGYQNKVKISIEIDEDIVEDKTFELSSQMKEQIAVGIGYMFNNEATSEEVSSTAIDLSSVLVNTLLSSDAVGVNLDTLKISDEYTFKHSVDVGTMALMIAKQMGKSESFMREIALAGILHDIGKAKIPLEILNKPGKLTEEEFKIMQTHPIYGYHMIEKATDIPRDVKLAVLEHHENVDGSGYPLGLKADRIVEMAKIITIADVYDALVSKRPYKEAKPPRVALEMLYGMSNKFDVNIMQTFLATITIYKAGELIHLSDGRTYKVIENNKKFPLRPRIKDIETGRIRDLSTDLDTLSLVIIE